MDMKKKEKIALCATARLENLYVREFVKHHIGVGFDKVILYDNNREGEERLEDVLQYYIKRNKVEVIPLHKDGYIMLQTYAECYRKYGKEFDWLLFMDLDEFFYPSDGDVHDFLADKTANCVSVSWETYGDNGLVTNDGRPLKKRFTLPLVGEDGRAETYGENIHVKSFVRGGLEGIFWRDPHCPSGCGTYAYADGSPRAEGPWHHDVCYNAAKIKHYTTKTIEEWMTYKVARGQFDCQANSDALRNNAISLFFARNKRTEGKMQWLKDHGFIVG